MERICIVFLGLFFAVNLGSAESAPQPGITITGIVTDPGGDPLPGVNVFDKVGNKGTVTDANGGYSLSVTNENTTLVFSYVGFFTQEILTNGRRKIDVTMSEDTRMIEEVVVIGYGTVKKSDLTGSVSSVSEKAFKDQPVKSIGDILQGRSAGVQVTTLNGLPGQTPHILIRGTTSLNKSSQPLYVVDGIFGAEVPNPIDIQSIEILKDASATAIYGSRGANGVVLITTKRGAEGKPVITIDANWGMSKIIKKYDLMSPLEYADMLQFMIGMTFPEDEMKGYRDGSLGIDWQDIMLQTAQSQDYKVNVSGGTQKTQYFVSASLLEQTAITINTNYNRYQFRTNLNTEVTPWFKIISNVGLSHYRTHNLNNYFHTTLTYSPTMLLKNPDTGIYNMDPYNSVNSNPYGMQTESKNDDATNRVIGNVDLQFKIIDGLTLSIQNALMFTNAVELRYTSPYANQGTTNSMSNLMRNTTYLQNTDNLTYYKRFGDHQITATGVWEVSQTEVRTVGVSGSNLGNATVVEYNNYLNAATRTGSNSYSNVAITSGLGRLMYTFKDRYMLTGTFRADGSSKFQGDNKWGYFPSGALAWDVTREDFFSNQNLFQQLKLRTSYGITGNQDISAYSTLGMLSSLTHAFGTTTRYTGYLENTFPTPDVTWEKVKQFDVGLDISMFDSRLNISLDGYVKNCYDLLLQKKIPDYNGGGTIWVNMGEVKNTGLDVTIDAFPVRTKDFVWQSVLTGAFQKNKVTNMGGEDYLLAANGSTYGGYFQIFKVGYPISSFWLYDWAGFDNEGCNLYRTQNGDIVNQPAGEDRFVTGKGFPTVSFGWNNMIRWKNWTVNIFMNGALGVDRMNMTRAVIAQGGGDSHYFTGREGYFKCWDKVENKADAKYSSIKNGNNRKIFMSTFWLEDAAFLKMKNISVSYQIPKDVLKVADVNLTFSVQNIFTITKYQGMDPEVYSGLSNVGGLDLGAYPVPRTYTLGMTLNF